MLKILSAWMVSFIVTQAPPERHQFIREAKETKEEARVRYESIAADITAVVFDEYESPLFKGPDGRLKSVAVMLSIMAHESNFRRDVDLGQGPFAKGDSGRSVCMMQLNIGEGRTHTWNLAQKRFRWDNDPPVELQNGWTAKEIHADRKKCIRAGLRVMRLSFSLATSKPVMQWLNAYTSGNPHVGQSASSKRMGLALTWYKKNPPALVDDDIIKALKNTTVASNKVNPASSFVAVK